MKCEYPKNCQDLCAGQKFDEADVQAIGGITGLQTELSHLADSKANIMITVCSILLSLAVAKPEQGVLVIPIIAFSVFCVPALLFPILTVMPPTGANQRDISHPSQLKNFNPLFFMHFSLLPMKTVEYEFERVMTDPQQLNSHVARDIYAAVKVLRTKQYRHLRWSYQSLVPGVIFGCAAPAVALPA